VIDRSLQLGAEVRWEANYGVGRRALLVIPS